MNMKILKHIPNIAYTLILARLNMIKSPDDTEPGYYQSNYAIKKVLPKIFE